MYSLEEAITYWDAAGRFGSREERLERGSLWQPYYSYLAEEAVGTAYQVGAQAKRTVEYMLREGILRLDDSLLDLGAGMGSYSIEFAKHCRMVTALDSNGDCLAVLKERAKQCGIFNIHCLNTAWEEYKNKEKFDAAFSAMCPAICNQEELLRLEAMTKRVVCLLTVTRGSGEKCRMELMKQLPLKKPGGMVTEALHYYNVLYQMGRQPNVKCWSEHFNTTAEAEKLIERYTVYLKLFGLDEGESVPFLREFFDNRAVNGMIEDECHMNYALVYWEVPEYNG